MRTLILSGHDYGHQKFITIEDNIKKSTFFRCKNFKEFESAMNNYEKTRKMKSLSLVKSIYNKCNWPYILFFTLLNNWCIFMGVYTSVRRTCNNRWCSFSLNYPA